MALIKCPECRKKISNQCNNCPNCGYPMKISVEENNTQENSEEDKVIIDRKLNKKKIILGGMIGVVLVAIIVTTIILINKDTLPRYDADGKPIFVDFTNEIYTNANDYLGYYIEIKGKVFQVMGDDNGWKTIQIWIDPDTCEKNLMISYNTDIEVKQGDYISCSGYIASVTKYKNAFDTELKVPLIYSSDLNKTTYIEVMSPTIDCILTENLKNEKHGYSVSVEKIEFSEIETRVYVTVTNNGKSTLNIDECVVVQDGKQYNSCVNYDANYEQLPYEIVQNASSTGIIVFPPLNVNSIKLSFGLHSDDWDEELGKYVFEISDSGSYVQETEVSDEIEETNEMVSEETQQETQTEEVIQEETKPIDRKQEAIIEVVNVANNFFPTDRWFVESILLNPSLEEGFQAFSYEEASYAIENAQIDWGIHAATSLSTYSNDYGFWQGPNDLVWYWLDNYGSFTDDEIKYAINNCGVDWNDIALKEAQRYIEEYKNRDEHITSYNIIDNLLMSGFSDENITYAIDNTDGYDKGVAEEPEERAMRLSGYGYSYEEIVLDFINAGWSREDAEKLLEDCGIYQY